MSSGSSLWMSGYSSIILLLGAIMSIVIASKIVMSVPKTLHAKRWLIVGLGLAVSAAFLLSSLFTASPLMGEFGDSILPFARGLAVSPLLFLLFGVLPYLRFMAEGFFMTPEHRKVARARLIGEPEAERREPFEPLVGDREMGVVFGQPVSTRRPQQSSYGSGGE